MKTLIFQIIIILFALAAFTGTVSLIYKELKIESTPVIEIYTPKNLYFIDFNNKYITNELNNDTVCFHTKQQMSSYISTLTVEDMQ